MFWFMWNSFPAQAYLSLAFLGMTATEFIARSAHRPAYVVHTVFALGPLLDWIARENRVAEREGRPPIVLRDYSVFLPERPVPQVGLASVAVSVLDNVRTTFSGTLAGILEPAATSSAGPSPSPLTRVMARQ